MTAKTTTEAPSRKAKITDEHREEAARLKAIYESVSPPSQKEFGKDNGIGSQGAVGNYLNGHSALNLEAATAFALALGCKIRDFSRRLALEAQKVAEASGLMSEDDFAPVPRLTVSAGAGPGRINSVVEEDGALQFRREFLRSISLRPENAAIINIRGGSMEPTIKDGAVVLVNRSDTSYRDGYIYAFVHGDEMLVKRFKSKKGVPVATSDNGDDDIVFNEMQPPKIEGRVVWMGAKL